MFSKIRGYLSVLHLIVTIFFLMVSMFLFNKHHRIIRKKWNHLQSFFLRYKIIQKGSFDPEANILLINHQGILDIIAIEALHPADPAWIAKKELAEIPILGNMVSIPEMIPVDRSDRRSLVKLLIDVKDRVNKGRVIAMFPEGTRGRGDKLLKFQSGAKVLAEKLGLKVQPVIVSGSRYLLDTKKPSAHSGTMTVTCLDLVDPKEDKNWYDKVKEDMSKVFADELANNPSHR